MAIGALPIRWCKHCHKQFLPTIPTKVYCCDNCRKRYYEKCNYWKIQDLCSCGNVKRKKAMMCKECKYERHGHGGMVR